ncbi:acyl-CoA thioesterase [Thermoproteota archaeon]
MKDELTIEVRVRYSDTDQMGVVYYANYFTWLEVARTEFFRVKGFNYRDIEKERSLALPVVEASCSYKSPALYDDLVVIKTRVAKVKNSSLLFEYNLYNKETNKLLAHASTAHAFIDIGQRKPVRIPKDIRQALECA